MQSTFFLKEVMANADKKVSFLMLSGRQIKDTLFNLIKEYSMQNKIVIIVSFFTPVNEIKMVFGGQNIYIADCTQSSEKYEDSKVIMTNPADLTSIMVFADSVDKKIAGDKVIIFDALNLMEVYNEQKKIGRFMHSFGNKTRMNENTLILMTVKDSTEQKTIELFKQFSDKSYDYSTMYISAIAAVDTK